MSKIVFLFTVVLILFSPAYVGGDTIISYNGVHWNSWNGVRKTEVVTGMMIGIYGFGQMLCDMKVLLSDDVKTIEQYYSSEESVNSIISQLDAFYKRPNALSYPIAFALWIRNTKVSLPPWEEVKKRSNGWKE